MTERKRDFKKEKKTLYAPGKKPAYIEVPELTYVSVSGRGDPNEEGGDYKEAIGLLYALSYQISMSYKSGHEIEGFYPYVVPPLEGLWHVDPEDLFRKDKSKFEWNAMIRIPEFVTPAVFEWARREVSRKKKLDTSKARLFTYHEGPCVQLMHVGPYDTEPESIEKIDAFIKESGLIRDERNGRAHHEIYLSDPRKARADRLKTVLRIPVKRP